MKRLQGILPVTSLQPPYSMLRRDIEKEILPFCGPNGIGVICYSPLQMGLLTGSFSRERVASLAADDLRGSNPHFVEPALSRNLALVEKLRPIAARNGRSVGELALAWVLSRPEVTAAIVGGRRPGQARGSCGSRGLDAFRGGPFGRQARRRDCSPERDRGLHDGEGTAALQRRISRG